MSADENKAVVRRFYANAASGDHDDQLIAEDFVYHGPAMLGEVRGREEFKRLLGVFRAAFPGFETEVTTLIAEGDVVAAWHTHRGRHGGEFAGVPPTGEAVAVDGLELLRVRDGQIVEFWHMDDFLGVMQQIGAVPSPSQEPAGGSTDKIEALVRRHFERIDQHDLDGAAEPYAAGMRFHGLTPQPLDREGWQQVMAGFLAAFPDARFVVEAMIVQHDKVAVRHRFQGTHRGEFQGVAPTGKAVDVPGTVTYRVADGKLVEGWLTADFLGLLQQIGAIPAPPEPGS